MTMKNPPHPGLSVRHDCIEPLGLTITEAAEVLAVTRRLKFGIRIALIVARKPRTNLHTPAEQAAAD